MKNVSELVKAADLLEKKLEKKALDPNFINGKIDQTAKTAGDAVKSTQNLAALLISARSDDEARRIQARTIIKDVGKNQVANIKSQVDALVKQFEELVGVL